MPFKADSDVGTSKATFSAAATPHRQGARYGKELLHPQPSHPAERVSENGRKAREKRICLVYAVRGRLRIHKPALNKSPASAPVGSGTGVQVRVPVVPV